MTIEFVGFDAQPPSPYGILDWDQVDAYWELIGRVPQPPGDHKGTPPIHSTVLAPTEYSIGDVAKALLASRAN